MAVGLIEEDTVTILSGAVVGVLASILGLSIIGSVFRVLVAGFNWLFGLA